MTTENTTISTNNNVAPQTRQQPRAAAAERQQVVTGGQNLPPQQATQTVAEQPTSVAAQRAEIDRAVSDIKSYVQTVNRELQFSLEEELPLGRAVIRVVDSDTDEVIREIPSEEVLQIAQRLSEFNESISVDDKIKGLIIQARA